MVGIKPNNQHSGRVKHVGFLSAVFMSAPHLLTAAAVGLAVYNPTKYCLWQLVNNVLFSGLGVMNDTAWYMQPAYWGLTALGLFAAAVAYFHWQIVRNEWVFLVIFLAFVAVINGLTLSVAKAVFHADLLSQDWVRWQGVPVFFAAVYFAVKVPRFRRQYTGATTVGGPSVEVIDDLAAFSAEHEHN